MEFGYIEAPHKSFPVVFDSPRNRGLRDFALKKILVCNQVHEVGREEVGDAGLWWLLSWEPWWSLIWSFRVRRLLGMVTATWRVGGRFHIRMQIVCKSYANRHPLPHYTVSHPGRDRTDVLRQGSVSVAGGHSQWESTETLTEGQRTLSELARDCGTPCPQDGSSGSATTEFWTMSPCFYGFPHSVHKTLCLIINNC